jgi:signal peptidase I
VKKSLCVIVIGLILVNTGCQKGFIQDPISDQYTKKEFEIVEPSANHIIIDEIRNDSMLGAAVYSLNKLVVDPEYYEKNELKRGDIVYFSYTDDVIKQNNLTLTKEDKQILRVVGLSEERISMKKGQIFINGKQLDTFYGYDMNNNLKELKEELKKHDLPNYKIENIKNMINFVENENINEILIPKEGVFLIGDNRGRALDSTIVGTISRNNIIGKLIGALK